MMISISSFIFIIIACFFVFLIFFVRRNIKVRRYFTKLPPFLISSCSTQKSNGQSLCADISIGLMLGAVIVVAVLSVLNNETVSETGEPPTNLEVDNNAVTILYFISYDLPHI